MRIVFLTLLAVVSLYAADERKLALEASAQASFEQVFAAAAPEIAAANQCVESQAMLLAVAEPAETPTIAFRKAYCALAAAAATDIPAAFSKAAENFDDAIADAQAAPGKQEISQQAPAAWRILAEVARLNGGAARESLEKTLAAAVDADGAADAPECQENGMSIKFCRSVQQVGSAWLGKIALERGDLFAAERRFRSASATAWSEWVAGLTAYRRGDYRASASDYGQAIATWRGAQDASLAERLGPHPEMAEALADWGGAQLAAGDPDGALAGLDAALKKDAANARAFYWRGVANERLGRNDAAAEDFDRASRAALAQTGEAAAAEAHFYRGIVYYGRKEFARAENEFASALSANVAASWREDARAWRHLAAVAGGACGASRAYLERALASVSPYFPKAEAGAARAACVAAGEAGPR